MGCKPGQDEAQKFNPCNEFELIRRLGGKKVQGKGNRADSQQREYNIKKPLFPPMIHNSGVHSKSGSEKQHPGIKVRRA